MIRYWDASAVVPLLIAETRTATLEALCLDKRLAVAAEKEGCRVTG